MFLELDKSRVMYVLTDSDYAENYVDFFKKNEKNLRVHKAKFKNAPKKIKEASSLILELPDSTKKILSDYLLSIKTIETYDSPGWDKSAIDEFKKKEKDDEYEIDPQKRKIFCNTILLEILKPNPTKALIKFLKSSINPLHQKKDNKNKIEKEIKVRPEDNESVLVSIHIETAKTFDVKAIENVTEEKFIVKKHRAYGDLHWYKAIAIIIDEEIHAISDSKLKAFFPTKGEIICFKNKHKPGEFLQASIETARRKDMPEQFQIQKFIDNEKYVEIKDSGANDIENLRNYLVMHENAIAKNNTLIKYNESIIRPKFEAKKLNFDVAFDIFSNITIHRINADPDNNTYYLLVSQRSIRGEAHGTIDLSDNFSRIKKILKKINRKDSKWTKSEINDLITQMKESQNSHVDLDFSVLENIIYSEDQKKELVDLLIETPQIEEKIEEGIATKVDEATIESEELTKREVELDEERKNFEATHKSKLIEFAKAIKATFNKEVLSGKETLSKMALYSAFFDSNNQKNSTSDDVRYQFKSIRYEDSDFSNLNELIPVSRTNLDHLNELIHDAQLLSLLPIIDGPSALFFAKLYAFNKKLNIDEYIIKNGLNHCAKLDEMDLESAEKVSLVINFDIAIFSLYAPYLYEKLVINGFQKDNDSKLNPLILISNNDDLNISNVIPEALKYLIIQFDPISIDLSSTEVEGASEKLKDKHIDDDEFKAKILKILQTKIQFIEDPQRRNRLANMICKQFDS